MSLIMGLAGLILGAVLGMLVAKHRNLRTPLGQLLTRAADGDLSARAGTDVPEEFATPLNRVLERAQASRLAVTEAADLLAAGEKPAMDAFAEQAELLALNARIERDGTVEAALARLRSAV